MATPNKTPKEIVAQYLRENGYAGLRTSCCECRLPSIAWCGDMIDDACRAFRAKGGTRKNPCREARKRTAPVRGKTKK